jgi:SAM-dependent methyltransferase
MINYSKHCDLLHEFYLNKKMSKEDAEFYVLEKVKKLKVSKNPFSYNIWLEKLIPYLKNKFEIQGEGMTILDFGCGSGEMVILLRHLGVEAYGYDIYHDEIKLAQNLAIENDISESIFFSDKTEFKNHLKGRSVDILTSFSVIEHLSDKNFLKMIDDFDDIVSYGFYGLVPSKYKIVDDHTGLKFLGLLPRNLSLLRVSMSGEKGKYKLSEDNSWDVWYRSLNYISKLSQTRDYILGVVDESAMYPNLLEVPKIGKSSNHSLGGYVDRLYGFLIRHITKNDENLYPYLNFILKK